MNKSNQKSALNKLNNAGRALGKIKIYYTMIICMVFFTISLIGLLYFLNYHRKWIRGGALVIEDLIPKNNIVETTPSEEYSEIENYDNYESNESEHIKVKYGDDYVKSIFVQKHEYNVGDKIDILYNPEKPHKMKLYRDYKNIQILIIFIMFFSLLGFILNYLFRKNKWVQRMSGLDLVT